MGFVLVVYENIQQEASLLRPENLNEDKINSLKEKNV